MSGGKIRKSCSWCASEVDLFRKLKKIIKDKEKVYLCKTCYAENRKGFRKESNRELAPLIQNNKEKPIKIVTIGKQLGEMSVRSSKYVPWRYRTQEMKDKLKTFKDHKKISLSLSQDDLRFLYSKYYKKGLDSSQVYLKVNEIKNSMGNFAKKLSQKNLPEEDLNKRFKEEFNKLTSR